MSEKAVLKLINNELTALGINYFYMVNDSETVTYPYATGEYHENDYDYEDNSTIGEMFLNLWTRGSELSLIAQKDLIKDKFKNYQTVILEDETITSVAINYVSKNSRYTGEEDLKRIEIRLQIKYWESD